MAIGNSAPGPNNLGGVLRGGIGNTPGKFTLSESVYGVPVMVGSSDTLVHDGSKSPGAMQEIYLWATNYSGGTVILQISVVPPEGTPFDSSNTIHAPLVSQNGLYLVYPGIPCINSKIYVKGASGSTMIVTGFIVEHYPKDINDLSAGYSNGIS